MLTRDIAELNFDGRAAWEALAAQTVARLQVRRARYTAATSEATWTEMAGHAANIQTLLRAYREYLVKPDQWWTDLRDPHMADNVTWILEQGGAGSKIVLWAHNAHVSKRPNAPGTGPLGNELERRFGDGHLAVGMFFNEGVFQAALAGPPLEGDTGPRIRAFAVAPAREGTIERAFSRTGLPLFALDLRTLPDSGAVAAWFAERRPTRDIGNRFSAERESDYYTSMILPREFDLVIFTARSTRPIPTRNARVRYGIAR